jgi:hypothetical protein
MLYTKKKINTQHNFELFTKEYVQKKFLHNSLETFIDSLKPLLDSGAYLAFDPSNEPGWQSLDYPGVCKNLHIVNSLVFGENALDIKFRAIKDAFGYWNLEIDRKESTISQRKDMELMFRKVRKDQFAKNIGFYEHDYMWRVTPDNIKKLVTFVESFRPILNNNLLEAKKTLIENRKWKISEEEVQFFIEELNNYSTKYNLGYKAHLQIDSERPNFRVILNSDMDKGDIVENEKWANYKYPPPALTEWMLGFGSSYMIFSLSNIEETSKWAFELYDKPYCTNDFITKNIGWKESKTLIFDNIDGCVKFVVDKFDKSREIYENIKKLGY